MTDTEIRVIELLTHGKDPEYRYAIQYRNATLAELKGDKT